MAAVAITQPLRSNRLRRLAVERVMTEVALAGGRARLQRTGSSTRTAKPRPGRWRASNCPP
jgi:hypothetical protein